MQALSDLKKRVLLSLVIIPAVAALLLFSSCCLGTFCLLLATIFFVAVGVWEYAQLAVAKGLQPAWKGMIGIAICEVLSFFLALKCSDCSLLPLITLTIGVTVLFLLHFKDATHALVHIAVEFFGVCYVAIPFNFILGILYNPIPCQDGRWWLAYLIAVTKVTDIGGYFIGSRWGKHKLAPALSPKKTVEGAIAGFLCAIGASLALWWLGQTLSNVGFVLNLLPALVLGMVIGVLGQLGDLAESLLKRDALVKDSNRLPGLGGILDLFDSLLFTAPIVYFFLQINR